MMVSTFLALFLMKNEVKTTMRTVNNLERFKSERGGLIDRIVSDKRFF